MTRLSLFVAEAPPWLVIAFWFAVFSAVAVTARWCVKRFASDERRTELAEHSNKLIGALGATFAFLVGFSISISWTNVGDGQRAVEDQAAYAQQLAWSIRSMQDDTMSSTLMADLETYLSALSTQDSYVLARGAGERLPSAQALDTLADAIHAYAFSMEPPGPEASMLVTNVQSLATGEAGIAAISQRQLPLLLAVLLVMSGAAMAAAVGIGAATVRRPYLLLVWCFVSALAMSVAFLLNHPFAGSLAVDFGPVTVVADSLADG